MSVLILWPPKYQVIASVSVEGVVADEEGDLPVPDLRVDEGPGVPGRAVRRTGLLDGDAGHDGLLQPIGLGRLVRP